MGPLWSAMDRAAPGVDIRCPALTELGLCGLGKDRPEDELKAASVPVFGSRTFKAMQRSLWKMGCVEIWKRHDVIGQKRFTRGFKNGL